MGELVFIGLGLYDERDVTLKGLEEARSCDLLFAEFYTSALLGTSPSDLTALYGKEVHELTRDEVEASDRVVEAARDGKVGFLVAGDPMAATTHVELRLRAHRAGVKTHIVAGVSSLTASAGALGLQAYKFGRTTTIPFPQEGYLPDSPYLVVADNRAAGLHTLILLDLLGDAYMTAKEGLEYLLSQEEKHSRGAVGPETPACVVGRLGSPNPLIRADRVRVLLQEDLGRPLQVIVVPGRLHFMEIECLAAFAGLPEEMAEELQT